MGKNNLWGSRKFQVVSVCRLFFFVFFSSLWNYKGWYCCLFYQFSGKWLYSSHKTYMNESAKSPCKTKHVDKVNETTAIQLVLSTHGWYDRPGRHFPPTNAYRTSRKKNTHHKNKTNENKWKVAHLFVYLVYIRTFYMNNSAKVKFMGMNQSRMAYELAGAIRGKNCSIVKSLQLWVHEQRDASGAE